MTKRRKRELEGTLEVEGYPLRWRLRSEQIWDPHGEHLGLRLSVERTDEAHRELILEFPFREMPGGKTERPDVDREGLADAIGEELVVDPALEAQLRERFAAFGTMPESNLRQALRAPESGFRSGKVRRAGQPLGHQLIELCIAIAPPPTVRRPRRWRAGQRRGGRIVRLCGRQRLRTEVRNRGTGTRQQQRQKKSCAGNPRCPEALHCN